MYGNGDNHGDDYDHYHGDEDDDGGGGGGDSMAICYLSLCAILGGHRPASEKTKEGEGGVSGERGRRSSATELYLKRTSTYIN